jgi:hypothetical protein
MKISSWLLILFLSGAGICRAEILTPVNGNVALSAPDPLGAVTAVVNFGMNVNPSDVQRSGGGPGNIHLGEFLFEGRLDLGLDHLSPNEAFRISDPATGGSLTFYNTTASFLQYTCPVTPGDWLNLSDGAIEFILMPLIESNSGTISILEKSYQQAPVVDVDAFSLRIINNPDYNDGGGSVTPVPEPNTFFLVAIALLGIAAKFKITDRRAQ